MESKPAGATRSFLGDDANVRQLIRWALKDEGMQVVAASDSRAALDAIARERPALVVLDMSLPLVDGYGVAAALRRAYGADVPILLITAGGRPAEYVWRTARRAPHHFYLTRPDLLRVRTHSAGSNAALLPVSANDPTICLPSSRCPVA